jgi:hypothetical protein
MEVTYLGSIVIVLAIFFSIWKPIMLFPLSITSSVFVGAAVLNIKSNAYPIGLQPFYFVNLVIFLRFIFIKKYRSNLFNRKSKIFNLFFKFLLVFVAYSGFSFLFTIVFSGIPVLGSRTGIDEIAKNNFDSLNFSFGGVAIFIYLIFNFFYIHFSIRIVEELKTNQDRAKFVQWLLNSYFLSGLFVALIGIYQKISSITGLFFPEDFIYSSISYNGGGSQTFGNAIRIASTFTEPSIAGSFLSAYSIFLFICFNQNQHKRSLIISVFILSCLTLLLTTSTTGYVSIFFIMIALFGGRFLSFIRQGKLRKTTMRNLLLLMFCLVGLLIFYLLSPQLQHIFSEFIFEKSSSASFINRNSSNQYSLQLLLRTFGFGVGLAGHRPSGLLFLVLSNLGVIGFLVFSFSFLIFPIYFSNLINSKKYFSIKSSSFAELVSFQQQSFWPYITFLVSMIIANPTLQESFLWIQLSLVMTSHMCACLYHETNEKLIGVS